jgi:hypothetical protein
MQYVQIQAQISGLWRTYNVVQNNSQRITAAMQELKRQFPEYRVRAIDINGMLVDLMP